MAATAENVHTQTAVVPEGKTTTLAAMKKAQENPEAQLPEVAAGFNSTRAFALLQRAGQALAAASMVPKIYQGNLPNCIIALEMAQRIGASPLMVMQNLYIVHNRPAWSAKFLIACFNACGRFSSVKYKRVGEPGKDSYGYYAYTTEFSTGETIEGPVIDWKLVKAERWDSKDGSKWLTMPEKMFRYRAAAWMIDVVAPEISMGIHTADEVEDAFDATRGPDGQYSVTTESLRQVEHETTGEVPAPKSPSSPDPVEWAKSLRAQAAQPELDAAWSACQKAFDGRPPDTCLVAFENRKEQLAEAAGKQLEL